MKNWAKGGRVVVIVTRVWQYVVIANPISFLLVCPQDGSVDRLCITPPFISSYQAFQSTPLLLLPLLTNCNIHLQLLVVVHSITFTSTQPALLFATHYHHCTASITPLPQRPTALFSLPTVTPPTHCPSHHTASFSLITAPFSPARSTRSW